jgi:hypothetical protein
VTGGPNIPTKSSGVTVTKGRPAKASSNAGRRVKNGKEEALLQKHLRRLARITGAPKCFNNTEIRRIRVCVAPRRAAVPHRTKTPHRQSARININTTLRVTASCATNHENGPHGGSCFTKGRAGKGPWFIGAASMGYFWPFVGPKKTVNI